MPAEGLDWLPTEETLTDDEVVRLVRIGVEQLGIREVRFTGGEPLLRRGLAGIVERTKALQPYSRGLADHQRAWACRGRRRRSRRPASTGSTSASTPSGRDVFDEITRRDRLDDVLAGLAGGQARRAAARSRSTPCSCAGVNDRLRGRAAALVPRAGLPAADHRADAARRPARLVARGDGHRRGDLRAAGVGVHADPRSASTGGARLPRPSSSTAGPPRSA